MNYIVSTASVMFIYFITLFSTTYADIVEWEITDMGTFESYNEAFIDDFNDQGQALIIARKINGKKDEKSWLLSSPNQNPLIIPDPIPGYWAPFKWLRINAAGIVAGTMEANTGTLENNLFLTIWKKNSATKYFRLPLTKEHPSSGYIAKCKMSDQIIISTFTDPKFGGSRDARVFSFFNDNIKELTPSLKELALEQGYNAGDWIISNVNSQGMLLGRFDYYENHPKKPGNLTPIGTMYFLFNNGKMTLIEFPEGLLINFGRDELFKDLSHIFLDKNGQVLFDSLVSVYPAITWENWVWDSIDGLKYLDQEVCIRIKGGQAKARAVCLTDNSNILWMIQGSDDCNGYYVQSQNDSIKLSLNKERQINEKDLGIFHNLKVIFDLKSSTWILNPPLSSPAPSRSSGEIINSKNQIFFIGSIYSEQHPFIIEPIEPKD